MKRFSVIRVFNKSLEEGDIGVFIGEGLCKEAMLYDRPGNLYFYDYDNMLSFSLGLAMCSSRRVFIFCDDSYFVKSISEVAHIAVSKCSNIYLVVLISGYYMDIGKLPNIFRSLAAPQNIMFSMGFLVHNYTGHFKSIKNPEKEINAIWKKSKGPLAAILNLDFGLKKIDIELPTLKESMSRLEGFLNNKDIPNYSYSPPVLFNGVEGQ
jgi:hypothetical protein